MHRNEGPKRISGGPGTEPEPETGTVGTVFPGTDADRTAGTVFQEPKPEPEPSSVLNCTETHKNPLFRGTARTENRNRSNRSILTVTEPNRTEATLGFVKRARERPKNN